MPTINAGASTALTVAVGTYLEGTGAGMAVIGPAAVVEPLTAGDAWQVGPFDRATLVSITAGSAITYTVKDNMRDPSEADKLPVASVAAMQALVSGARKNSRLAARFAGGTTPGAASLLARTWICRFEAEAPFKRVRVHFFSTDITATAGPIIAAAAATDTLAETTATLRSQPHRNGTPYNTLAANPALPGWSAMTFGGAANGTMTQAPSTFRNGVVSTDWLDLASCDRTDVVGGRPAWLLRAYGNIKWGLLGNFTTDADATVTAWRNNGTQPWYRVYDMSSITTTDGVTDLTQNGGSISNSMVHIAVEYDYDVPGKSVLAIGDSLTEGQYERAKYAPWQRLACNLASSQTMPVTFMNMGVAGQAASVFDAPGLDMITLLQPTHIFHQAYSPNDGNPTEALVSLSKSRLNRTLAAARVVGARVCVWTPLPKNFSAGEDAIRLAFRSYLLSRAALGEFDVIDIDPTMSSGATPATIATAYRFDTTHYNAAGMDVLAALGADYLRSSG